MTDYKFDVPRRIDFDDDGDYALALTHALREYVDRRVDHRRQAINTVAIEVGNHTKDLSRSKENPGWVAEGIANAKDTATNANARSGRLLGVALGLGITVFGGMAMLLLTGVVK